MSAGAAIALAAFHLEYHNLLSTEDIYDFSLYRRSGYYRRTNFQAALFFTNRQNFVKYYYGYFKK